MNIFSTTFLELFLCQGFFCQNRYGRKATRFHNVGANFEGKSARKYSSIFVFQITAQFFCQLFSFIFVGTLAAQFQEIALELVPEKEEKKPLTGRAAI